jgi:cyclohexa-1,5-dienecarbonyl-CoA hydratase
LGTDERRLSTEDRRPNVNIQHRGSEMSQAFKDIRLAGDEEVGRITLDRPPLNVLNIAMMEEIQRALDYCRQKPHLKAVVFDANGKAFSAGVDVEEHRGEAVKRMLDVFHGIFRQVVAIGRPTVAVVQGAALGGGCELAAFCDFVIASERAKFGQPEIKVGVFPPVAAAIFPRLVGSRRAADLILRGDTIDAQEALQIGLVNEVVSPEELEGARDRLLASLREKSGAVLGLAKRALTLGEGTAFGPGLESIEDLYLAALMKTEDAEEGLRAFLEKRRPAWKDR